jgi:hypothetical protein
MADETEPADDSVPDGAAVFPEIPAELGVSPLLLAVVHAVVFLEGSSEAIVNGPAAGEALEYVTAYLQRLTGKDLDRVREDMDTLTALAKQEKWPREMTLFLKSFLADFGVGGGGES